MPPCYSMPCRALCTGLVERGPPASGSSSGSSNSNDSSDNTTNSSSSSNGSGNSSIKGSSSSSLPFLFDTATLPSHGAACGHCETSKHAVHCCGLCHFDGGLCRSQYPRQNKSEAVVELLTRAGFRLQVGQAAAGRG